MVLKMSLISQLMKCTYIFYYILYAFAHLCLFIHRLWTASWSKLKTAKNHCIKPVNEIDYFLLKNVSNNISKTPQHLGIIVGENDISLRNIASLVISCAIVGVKFVTVYDIEGQIRLQKELLHEHIKEGKRKLLKKTEICNGTYPNNNDVSKFLNIEIRFLSYKDGKQRIVEKAKSLVDSNLNIDELTVEELGKILSFDGFPDPSLVLCYGTSLSVIGYPPWHLHLSEIHFYPSHHKLLQENFVKSIEKYGRCQQRFGK